MLLATPPATVAPTRTTRAASQAAVRQVPGCNPQGRQLQRQLLLVILKSGGSARRSRSRRCAGTMNIGRASLCCTSYGRRNRASRWSSGWNRRNRKNSGSSRACRRRYLLRLWSHTGRSSSYWTCTYTALLATSWSAPRSPHGASQNAYAFTAARARSAAALLYRNG